MMYDQATADTEDHRRDLLVASWVGTVLFVATASLATAFESLRIVGLVTALALFGFGTVAFLVAFAAGLERSRTEELSVFGLYFLTGSTPRAVQWNLWGSAALQTIVAFTTASLRPFTSLAFGILVPMYGLGVAGLWAARHGSFPSRTNRTS